jgi:hypothetical protein
MASSVSAEGDRPPSIVPLPIAPNDRPDAGVAHARPKTEATADAVRSLYNRPFESQREISKSLFRRRVQPEEPLGPAPALTGRLSIGVA